MKIKELVIDRNKWGTEYLLAEDNTMCCLGFLALACGASPDEIQGEVSPHTVANVDWPAAFIKRSLKKLSLDSQAKKKIIETSNLATIAMGINDDMYLSWGDKEKKLIKLFKKAGIKLSFIGASKDKKKA